MGSCDGKRVPTRDRERGKDYNHSSFIDLIIAGLVGLRAALSALLVVQPLAPSLGWFALDSVAVHGHDVSVIYDPHGTRWGNASAPSPCTGLCVFVDGKLANHSPTLARLTVHLPDAPSQR